MGNRQNKRGRPKGRVHDHEGELVERISSATGEVDWPAPGSFFDCSYRTLKRRLEIDSGNRTALFVPR
jgi:hypothetical protein